MINIPGKAVPFILFQRSYFRLPVTFLYRHLFSRFPFETPIYNLSVAIESRLYPTRVKRLYRADMAAEFRTLLPALPERCAAILDIGCGVGGIDVFLDRHYADQAPDFYLFDRSQVQRSVYYLFKPQAAFYNSLGVTQELLEMNDIVDERIHLLEANDSGEIPVTTQFDLVISLLSWGFHYSVATYCTQVRELLRDDGVLILDVRRNTDGLVTLKEHFGTVQTIIQTEKYERVLAQI